MQITTDCLLFDLDGTLVDSTQSIANHWRSWSVINNLDPNMVEVISKGRTARDTIQFVVGNAANVDELVSDFIYQEILLAKGLTPIPYAAEFLSQIPIEVLAKPRLQV